MIPLDPTGGQKLGWFHPSGIEDKGPLVPKLKVVED